MIDDPRRVARAAFDRAGDLEREILSRWPDAWQQLDHLRAHAPVQWPDWCLLPMAAPASLATAPGRPRPTAGWEIAAMSVLYAWRYARSVYIVEPNLLDRLLTQIPDALGVDDLVGLPEWAVYVAGEEGRGGLWMHLEHDVNTGRPELRLLLDVDGKLLPIPVYLDRGTVTEALADYRATAVASAAGPGEVVPGQDIRGAYLDVAAADLAERIEGYLAVAAYLARPEADIGELGRPGVRPVRRRKPASGRTVWLVGYQST